VDFGEFDAEIAGCHPHLAGKGGRGRAEKLHGITYAMGEEY
jgi:hypothetical protein